MCVHEFKFHISFLSHSQNFAQCFNWQTTYMSTTLSVDILIYWVKALLVAPDDGCCLLYNTCLHLWRLNRFAFLLSLVKPYYNVVNQACGWLQGRPLVLMKMDWFSWTKYRTSKYMHHKTNDLFWYILKIPYPVWNPSMPKTAAKLNTAWAGWI
jgi:hypothetical protein